MLNTTDDLRIAGTDLFLDSRKPRATSFMSHAHSDHIASHTHAICTPDTMALAKTRVEVERYTSIPYHVPEQFDSSTRIELVPAGHVLGSAMLYVSRGDETLVYTGDFKLRECLTVPPATARQGDILIMETTYGLPFFRFPPRETVVAQLLETVEDAFRQGRQPIVLGYSLGKAQEITRILTQAGHRVTVHGSVFRLNQIYRELGVELGQYQPYRREDFHGNGALDLMERGVLVAPPQVARSAFTNAFENPCRIMMSGWAILKNAIYRYGVEHALPLSDHADFDELLELVERVAPRKVYTVHGYGEFAETLRKMGIDAEPVQKDPQLKLFEE